MLDQEPLWYPSGNRFSYNPAIPDRQLWAIGMVAVQWSMTEMLVEQQIHIFINGNPDLLEQYKRIRNFRATLDFFQTRIELKAAEPLRSHASVLVGRIRNLSSQRHTSCIEFGVEECLKILGTTPGIFIQHQMRFSFGKPEINLRKPNHKTALLPSTGGLHSAVFAG
jgi:hypothetical protein